MQMKKRPAGTGRLKRSATAAAAPGPAAAWPNTRRARRRAHAAGGVKTDVGHATSRTQTSEVEPKPLRFGDKSSSIRPVKIRRLLARDEGGGAAAADASVTTTNAETNDTLDQKRQSKACGDTPATQRVMEKHDGVCQPPQSKRDPPAVSTNAGHTASSAAAARPLRQSATMPGCVMCPFPRAMPLCSWR